MGQCRQHGSVQTTWVSADDMGHCMCKSLCLSPSDGPGESITTNLKRPYLGHSIVVNSKIVHNYNVHLDCVHCKNELFVLTIFSG